jgi:HlyD family secretion protein
MVTTSKGNSQQVWTLANGIPLAIPVTTGVSDGTLTEIVAGNLKQGMLVINDNVSPAK